MLPYSETAPSSAPLAGFENPYEPHMARIITIRTAVPDNHIFTLRFVEEPLARGFDHRPGQFIMLSVPGVGEAPFSICSSPSRPGVLEVCVRRAGRVTNALYRLRMNDAVGIRGPFGNGFPIERMQGNDLLIAAGGLGMAAVRPLLWYALDNREQFDRITVMYGARRPAEMLFADEMRLLVNRSDIRCLLTVDEDPTETWQYYTGYLPALFSHARLDPARTCAAVCGPPIVFKLMVQRLLEVGFTKDRILMSLERRMKCGVGKCGHCSVGYKYTCVHGPIFTYWDAINLPEVI